MSTTEATGAGQASVRHFVLPLPVIDWTTVVKADDPTREATRGRLRELRNKQRVSPGVTVARRGRRGMQGRATYYSVLAALAAKSRQEGHDEDAARLEKGASVLEKQFAARLEQFLSQHSLTQLPEADFFYELTAATAQRIAEWSHLPRALLAAARVDDIEGDVAHLEGSSPQGDTVAIDLPRALLDRQSLATGDLVWVFSRVVGDAALVELLPAIRVEVDFSYPGNISRGPNALIDVAIPEENVVDASDGLTEEERAEYAAQFSATVSAELTADEVADLRGDVAAGRVSRRRLRPAG